MPEIRYYRDPLAPDQEVLTDHEWVDTDAYRQLVQRTVISCTDVVLTLVGDPNAIYLAKRCVFPQKGIWCFGGRLFFNDGTLPHSSARCLNTEAAVPINPDRFVWTKNPHLYSWVKTAQGDFGGKNLVLIFRLEVTPYELGQIARGLSPKEYDRVFGIQRFTRERLVDEKVHKAMHDAFNDIWGAA